MLEKYAIRLTLVVALFTIILGSSAVLFGAEPTTQDTENPATSVQPQRERYLDKAIDPDTYIVGPGDRFLISFYGAAYQPFEVEILPEGIVSIPEVGAVNVGQITLSEAKQMLLERIQTRYKGEEVGVSLSRLRLFKVNVTGAVAKPGAVVVSASDRVSEAVELAGGLEPKASQRNISLIENPGRVRNADLALFNATGDMAANPYLHEGQVITVPMVSDSLNTVEIYGAVNRPDTLEYRSGDRVYDLLRLGFGPRADADLEHAELVRFNSDGGKSSRTVNLAQIMADPSSPENVTLMPDDRLFLRAIAGYHQKERVTIRGEVVYPGDYPIEDGCLTVSELVARAGGILPTASLSEAQMVRQLRPGEMRQDNSLEQLLKLSTDKLTDFELQYLKVSSASQSNAVAVDFNRLIEEGRLEYDVPLRDGDVITIPPKSYSVTVLGRVVNPGQVPFKENENVDYYVRLAGGFGYKADKKGIRIIKVNTGSVVKPDHDIPIEMGDRIMVPEKTGTDWWGLIKDAGLFLANVATIYVVVDQAIQ
jgi:protein involved in polysaccharide export with SLBB domain